MLWPASDAYVGSFSYSVILAADCCESPDCREVVFVGFQGRQPHTSYNLRKVALHLGPQMMRTPTLTLQQGNRHRWVHGRWVVKTINVQLSYHFDATPACIYYGLHHPVIFTNVGLVYLI